jgi:hypothetical protein
MTIKELLETLKNYNQDSVVAMQWYSGPLRNIGSVNITVDGSCLIISLEPK